MGLGAVFLMIAVSVSAHELSHILVAKVFGCKVRELKISALGEMAFVQNMGRLSAWKRSGILAAGPLCNLLLWVIAVLLARHANILLESMDFELFGFYNLVLCIFNLLPIFPLDGARLLQLWVGNRVGAMRANRFVLRSGRMCCVALMLLGVVQAILYAPNFTMLFAGFVLWRKNRSLQVELSGEFYMAMMDKPERMKKRPLSVRALCVYSHQPLPEIVDAMGWDNVIMLMVTDYKNITVSEMEILDHVIKCGKQGLLSEILVSLKSS